MKHVIQQTLIVEPWPLESDGDEKFFGYIVAVGVLPDTEKNINSGIMYADFTYKGQYTRYQIPMSESLHKGLLTYLEQNLWEASNTDSFSGKLCITRIGDEYAVDLP